MWLHRGVTSQGAWLHSRFIFHGRVGSKVDAAVTFPLELGAGLVCGRREGEEGEGEREGEGEEEGVLELRGCVCHFGSEWQRQGPFCVGTCVSAVCSLILCRDVCVCSSSV